MNREVHMSCSRLNRRVLICDHIFTGTSNDCINGFIAIKNNVIEKVGRLDELEAYVKDADEVLDYTGKLITAGFVDTHTFFTGWVQQRLGVDFSGVHTEAQAIEVLKQYQEANPNRTALFGHHFEADLYEAGTELDKVFDQIPVVVFTSDRGTCLMNQAARDAYGFTPEECYAEKIWKMIAVFLKEPEMKQYYYEYMKALNAKGVTSIKEMSFDEYDGFCDTMEELANHDELSVRVHLMSQPVRSGINIAHGKQLQARWTGPFLQFSGYNRMTDRSIGSSMAELKEDYKSMPGSKCLVPVEWDLIRKELIEADANGFRYSLHAQGDGAIGHLADLYEQLPMENGKLKHRHAVTDLEFSDPEDLKRLGKIGTICEVYAQIQSFDGKEDVMQLIDKQLGIEKGHNYWNRRQMWDSGCCVCCGTDLPLLFPDIPESIYHGCGGYMNDGQKYNEQNMLRVDELLKAWTVNGQYDCLRDDVGTIEEGKLADIAVLSENLLEMDPADAKRVEVIMTISDGRIVYQKG